MRACESNNNTCTDGQGSVHVAVRRGLSQLAFAQPPVHGNAGEQGVALLPGCHFPTHRRRSCSLEDGAWRMGINLAINNHDKVLYLQISPV